MPPLKHLETIMQQRGNGHVVLRFVVLPIRIIKTEKIELVSIPATYLFRERFFQTSIISISPSSSLPLALITQMLPCGRSTYSFKGATAEYYCCLIGCYLWCPRDELVKCGKLVEVATVDRKGDFMQHTQACDQPGL